MHGRTRIPDGTTISATRPFLTCFLTASGGGREKIPYQCCVRFDASFLLSLRGTLLMSDIPVWLIDACSFGPFLLRCRRC